MIDRTHRLSVTRQARLLALSRASVYYVPRPVPDEDLAQMRGIDELHLELPLAGSRMLRDLLRGESVAIGREHVRTLMRRMGITAIYRRPKTRRFHRGVTRYPGTAPIGSIGPWDSSLPANTSHPHSGRGFARR